MEIQALRRRVLWCYSDRSGGMYDLFSMLIYLDLVSNKIFPFVGETLQIILIFTNNFQTKLLIKF